MVVGKFLGSLTKPQSESISAISTILGVKFSSVSVTASRKWTTFKVTRLKGWYQPGFFLLVLLEGALSSIINRHTLKECILSNILQLNHNFDRYGLLQQTWYWKQTIFPCPYCMLSYTGYQNICVTFLTKAPFPHLSKNMHGFSIQKEDQQFAQICSFLAFQNANIWAKNALCVHMQA